MEAANSPSWPARPPRPRRFCPGTQSPATLCARVRAARRAAGRAPAGLPCATLVPTAVGQPGREALDVLRPGLAFYAGFFPRYNRMMAEHGFAGEAAAIAEAWSRGDREAAEQAVSDG